MDTILLNTTSAFAPQSIKSLRTRHTEGTGLDIG